MEQPRDSAASARHRTEVWAQLTLCRRDAERIRAFFSEVVGIREEFITKGMHLTVYHARRPMVGVRSSTEGTKVALYADETRFMVLAPGGENPRPELDPARRKVGIRVQRLSASRLQIESYRERLLLFESSEVLGSRNASTQRSNAFGARSFQPHMTLLQAGSGIDKDLTKVGKLFRVTFGCFLFDRFEIKVRTTGPVNGHPDELL